MAKNAKPAAAAAPTAPAAPKDLRARAMVAYSREELRAVLVELIDLVTAMNATPKPAAQPAS